jgi:Na+/proline symporter
LVACVVAVNLSACFNFRVEIWALFTRNYYARYFRPQASDAEVLWVSQTSGLGLTLFSVAGICTPTTWSVGCTERGGVVSPIAAANILLTSPLPGYRRV